MSARSTGRELNAYPAQMAFVEIIAILRIRIINTDEYD